MMKSKHYGWFSFCPVILGDVHSACPTVAPRWSWLEPVLKLAVWVQGIRIAACTLINPDWQPTWSLWVGRKIQ